MLTTPFDRPAAGSRLPPLARCRPAAVAAHRRAGPRWPQYRLAMTPARSDTAVPDSAPDSSRARRDAQLAAWVQQAALGDAPAFERFYDATIGYAHALARRLVRDADIDDALAEAYFQAWREAPRFDAARGSAVTWLLTRVHSRAIDLCRQRTPADESDEKPPANCVR